VPSHYVPCPRPQCFDTCIDAFVRCDVVSIRRDTDHKGPPAFSLRRSRRHGSRLCASGSATSALRDKLPGAGRSFCVRAFHARGTKTRACGSFVAVGEGNARGLPGLHGVTPC
jgi:hypothetical protein